jgi:hypothetical protein
VVEDFNGRFEIVRWTELQLATGEQDIAAMALPTAT